MNEEVKEQHDNTDEELEGVRVKQPGRVSGMHLWCAPFALSMILHVHAMLASVMGDGSHRNKVAAGGVALAACLGEVS